MNKSSRTPIQHPKCCSIVEDGDLNILLTGPSDLLKGYPAFRVMGPPEMPKCNVRAAALRRRGNKLYAQLDYKEALMKYNESICAATADSEDLGMGYANRSAIYVSTRAFEVALADIALAKKHNYPERLMAKLLEREARCRFEVEENSFERKQKLSPLSLNVEANPKIPFLAAGIRVREHPTHGHVMVAERNFKVGDVILHEKPMLISCDRSCLYLYCSNCFTKNVGYLIPCPDCAAAMFCNEECIKEGRRLHRFECGISNELSRLGHDWLGPKMFFHALSLLDDDIEKMMEFCANAKGTVAGNFFNMDYSKYNELEAFKVFLNVKCERSEGRPSSGMEPKCFRHNAGLFLAMYMKNPLVQSLITTKEQQTFMLQCFNDFPILVWSLTVLYNASCMLFPITAGFSHSCDPKTFIMPTGNSSMMIVTRPIRRGEQIDISYGPACYQEPLERRTIFREMGFKCSCDYCDKQKRQRWLAKANQESAIDDSQWTILQDVLRSDAASIADKLHAIQQFIQRFASHYPQKDFAGTVGMYREMVANFYIKDYQDARTQKLTA